jgi:hypothetical protein
MLVATERVVVVFHIRTIGLVHVHYLTLSCSMSNETRKGVKDDSISIHHESCIMLEQAFPNFVKKNQSWIFYIMETDEVGILTMTTHEDSKKDDNLIAIPSGKIKRVKRMSQQAAIISAFIIISSKKKLVQKLCARSSSPGKQASPCYREDPLMQNPVFLPPFGCGRDCIY